MGRIAREAVIAKFAHSFVPEVRAVKTAIYAPESWQHLTTLLLLLLSCVQLCDLLDCSLPAFPVPHHLTSRLSSYEELFLLNIE